MSNQKVNPLESAQMQVKAACDALGLDDKVYEMLKEPQRVIELSIPVNMDDGSFRIFKGYRALHNNAVGPGKGGIRFHPQVDLDETKALSIWMTFKAGVIGLPYGGAKGGVTADPLSLSDNEMEQIARGYVRGMVHYLGEKIDIPAPDVGSSPKVMAWMTDEFMKLTGRHEAGVYTGKPVPFGGSEGRDEATGFGVAVVAREVADKVGIELEGANVIVQGFGNVGRSTVKNFIKLGAKVTAIGEWAPQQGTYAIYNEEGLDFDAMFEFQKENGNLVNFPGGEMMELEDFWKLEADIVCPAALENAVGVEEAEAITAKLVVEAANGPVTPEADKVFEKNGVTLSPDILTNAGGVTVSYFEWVQNLYGYYWDEEEVEAKEEEAMVKAFNEVWDLAQEYDVTLRKATYMLSVKKVADVMEIRGWI